MAENVDVRTASAMNKGAVSVTDFGELASPRGAPLDLAKGNDHVVVLFPTPCCNHHGSRAVPRTDSTALFNTAEHIITVAGCRLRTPTGTSDALTALLPVGPPPGLTYGQLIGLGGDFFGDPDQPVSTAGDRNQQIAQFRKNFEQLQALPDQVTTILAIADKYEFKPISHKVSKNQPPSAAYADIPWTKAKTMNDEDLEFDTATGGGGPGSPIFGRYVKLAATNLDHFGEEAVTCYMAGHILAQTHATQAKQSQDPAKELKIAYAINAFADHFLTDLFAAGHMRTPRRRLYEYSPLLAAAASGLCTKGMHDEDNRFGLWVENARGDKWVAYGDARYRDFCNAANRKVMKAALQQSIDDVWNAFEHGTVVTDDNCEVLKYLPTIVKATGDTSKDEKNWAPLFYYNPDDGYIYQRNSLGDVSDRTYDWKFWSGLSKTAFELQFREGPYMPRQEYESASIPYPPNEKGPDGEVGWPPHPRDLADYKRVMAGGVTGPDLGSLTADDWRIDGSPGPSAA